MKKRSGTVTTPLFVAALLMGPLLAQDANQGASAKPKFSLGGAIVQMAQHAKSGKGNMQRSSTLLEFPRWQEVEEMQIAFVIDNTESMGANIEDLKAAVGKFVSEIEAGARSVNAKTKFSLALVAYNDSASGKEHELVTGQDFTEIQKFQDALKNLTTVTGQPYFNELVDVGVNAAAMSLNWKAAAKGGPGIAKWIVVCGDAPPYPESGAAQPNTPTRRFTNAQLLEGVKARGIVVHGIICDTGYQNQNDPALQATFLAEKPHAIEFLKTLAGATGGAVIDLSDVHTLDLLNKMAMSNGFRFKRVTGITPEDIARFRVSQGPAGAKQDVLVAVLPLLPISADLKNSLKPDSQEMLVAMSIARHLLNISAEVMSPTDVIAAWESLSKAGADTPQKVAEELGVLNNVKFVITGAFKKEGGNVELTLELYDGLHESAIATVKNTAEEKNQEKLISQCVKDLYLRAKSAVSDPVIQSYFTSLDVPPNRAALAKTLSKDRDANGWMLQALIKAEQATQFSKDEADGKVFLSDSKNCFERALQTDGENVLAHLMIASVTAHEPALQEVRIEHVSKAFELAQKLDDSDPLKWEAIGDYHLTKTLDFPQAVKAYEKILELEGPELSSAVKRAHWMLAGLGLGDWIPESQLKKNEGLIDPDKAREHILTIVTKWPESPEAAFYNKCILSQRSGAEEIDIPSETHEQTPAELTFASLARL